MAGLRLSQLTRNFRAPGGQVVPAVDRLSLEVFPSEFLVLAGPSGSGKTTTLRLIAGLETPESGDVRFDGRSVLNTPPQDRNVALVFQRGALYPHMTVRQNLASGLRWRQVERRTIGQRVSEISGSLKLDDILDRLPETLSGGQQQRAALARALILKPDILLLDEPLSNLDLPARRELRQHLKAIRQLTRATIVYVTHDQQEALTLGDRIALLHRGRLQQAGTPAGIYNRPENLFTARFFGSPPMNTLPGVILAGHDSVCLRLSDNLSLPLPDLPGAIRERSGQPAILAFRPEHCRFLPASDAAAVPARVNDIELPGAHSVVHLRLDRQDVAALAPPGEAPPHRARVSIAPDWSNVHWFCPETGQRLA